MRPHVRNMALVGGMAAIGAYVYWRSQQAQRERQRRLDGGEARELIDVWTAIDGCRCFARMQASGVNSHPPLVFVHGFGVSSAYFVPLAERLSTEFDVYAPDLPGHGLSDTPTYPLDIRGLARALVHWLDALQLDRVVLVGNSMGAQIAAEAAVRHPERIDRLVLIGPTLDRAARTFPRALVRLLADIVFEPPGLYPVVLRDYVRMMLRVPAEFSAMVQDRIEAKLPRIEQPVLLVHGEHDPIAPTDWIDELARMTPNAQVALIPKWGHAVHYSGAEELAHVITSFVHGDDELADGAHVGGKAQASENMVVQGGA